MLNPQNRFSPAVRSFVLVKSQEADLRERFVLSSFSILSLTSTALIESKVPTK